MEATPKERMADWRQELAGQSPQEIWAWAARQFGGRVALASSLGLEDMALTDMISREDLAIKVFTLDTGRLFQETYELMHEIEKHYALRIEVYFPDTEAVEAMVREHGVNLFYQSVAQRRRCCQVRKVEPLKRALSGLDAWITGLRRKQAVTRRGLKIVEWDETHNLVKLNPLADWSESQVKDYVRQNDVPANRLYDENFASIGCLPCTRAIEPGEDVRAGRWWWETPDQKECGLHAKDGKPVRAKEGADTDVM